MQAIVGLGNPGGEYAGMRHNVGWMVVERLAERHGTRIDRTRRRGLRAAARYGQFEHQGRVVRVIEPWLLMNRSGEALRAFGDELGAEDVLLVCDDVNLPLGRLRIRAEGGAGGHHGLASCLEALGTEQVARLRIGVGGGAPGADLVRVVLAKFRPDEQPQVAEMLERAAAACETWIEHGIEAAMNRHNAATETA